MGSIRSGGHGVVDVVAVFVGACQSGGLNNFYQEDFT
jgi:hypothetical protein